MKNKRKEPFENGKILSKAVYNKIILKGTQRTGTILLSVFLALLVLLGVGKVGWIAIIQNEKYNAMVEERNYRENTVLAKRGSIYDSNMDFLAESYFVWDFYVDPYHLNKALSKEIAVSYFDEVFNTNYKDSKETIATFRSERGLRYIQAVAKGICHIIGSESLTESDLVGYLTKTGYVNEYNEEVNNVYQKIIRKVDGNKYERLKFLLSKCYYNYAFDKFYVASSDVPDSERTKEEKETKIYTPRFYDPVKDEYSPVLGQTVQEAVSGGAYTINAKSAKDDVGLKCIVREGSAFIYEQKQIRAYRNDTLASSILGYVSNGSPTGGIETYYNSTLSGTDGMVRGLAVNESGTMTSKSNADVIEAQPGYDIVLTIDSDVQEILEDNLKMAYNQYEAQETFGAVMKVDTGAIIAMANYPDYSLTSPTVITEEERALAKAREEILADETKTDEEGNKIEPSENKIMQHAKNSQWSTFFIGTPYEVGSTFKIFTAAAALEEGVSIEDHYCTGAVKLGDDDVECLGYKHKTVDMANAIRLSCNGFFVKLGLAIGQTRFNKYFKAFGFTEPTGIDIYGENVGMNKATQKMTKVELGSTAYGQTATITGIQLLTACCAIANGGKLVKPYVVDKIIDSDGNLISKTEPVVKRTVVSKDTCKKITEMMEKVVSVEGGTAFGHVNIKGFSVAGKTGSGEYKNGVTKERKYTGSFLGFAPADNPEYAILIGVRNPEAGKNDYHYIPGGKLAGPAASNVLSFTLNTLGVQSQKKNTKEGTATDVVDMPIKSAKNAVANDGYTYNVFGTGDYVISQIPSSGSEMRESGVIALITDEAEDYRVSVPNFIGMTRAEAFAAARSVGLNISVNEFDGDDYLVTYQKYDEGRELIPGSCVDLYFDKREEVESKLEESTSQAVSDSDGETETSVSQTQAQSEEETTSSSVYTEQQSTSEYTTNDTSYTSSNINEISY